MNCVKANMKCVKPNMNCVRANMKCVRANMNCVRANMNCVKANMNCVRANMNCVRANMNCVKANMKCVKANMKCVKANLNCGYDAENHQKEFYTSSNSGSTPDATYIYDGEGRRVKKTTSTETTIFVYDASSRLVAEYSTALATVQQVSYLTQDHLGSPRVTTNENGSVTNRKDFMAFGDEAVSSQRASGSSGNGYDPAAMRKDYTGYEKDGESGLEFAQARYYNTQHGRYTSVDPMIASATIKNPQTFNRYSYVLNSPYKFVDPLGLISSATGACGQWCQGSDGGGGSFGTGHDSSAADYFENQQIQRSAEPPPIITNQDVGDLRIQTETRTYTVVQTETDGRQATITVTSTVTRTIDRTTNRQIGSDSNPVVTSIGANTGRVNFSSGDTATMRAVAEDIVSVALTNKMNPSLFLAMAQRETHLGIGAIGDPRNVGKAGMKADINPLQLDGDANGKYWASPTDRLYNLKMSMQLFQENVSAAKATNLSDGLSIYNSGRFANRSSKGRAYAADIIRKSSAIRETISFSERRLF